MVYTTTNFKMYNIIVQYIKSCSKGTNLSYARAVVVILREKNLYTPSHHPHEMHRDDERLLFISGILGYPIANYKMGEVHSDEI